VIFPETRPASHPEFARIWCDAGQTAPPPTPVPSLPVPFVSLTCGDESRADVRRGAARCGGRFQLASDRQARTVKKRRGRREMRWRRSGRSRGNWYTVPRSMRWRCSGWCGGTFKRRVAGADGEGAAVEERCDGSPASRVGIGTPYNGKAAVFSSQRQRLSSNDPIETAPTTRPVHPHTSSFGEVPIGI
jgi:hypothetical protein